MKIVALSLALPYGAFSCASLFITLDILDGLSAWGDGATHMHRTPLSIWVPICCFFAISATGPFIGGRYSRRVSGAVALSVLLVALCFIVGIGNAVFVWIIVCILSAVVWIPLAFTGGKNSALIDRGTE